MASILKRGKYWRVQIRRKGYPTLSSTFDTEKEAELWAAQQEKTLAEQSPAQVIKRMQDGSFTMGQAFDRYIEDVLPSKRPSTQIRDKGHIRRIVMALGDVPLANLKPAFLTNLIKQWQGDGLSANTIRIRLNLISHLYGVSRKEWEMTDLQNPVELIRRPKLPQGRDRRLDGNEEERLVEACSQINPELADIVLFAIETAMRQGEIISMEWLRVNWVEHTLYLPHGLTKTDTARVIPLSEKAEEILRRQQVRATGKDGKVWKYTSDGMRASYQKAVKRAGIVGLTFHDLRHEATSRLCERGIHIMTVQAITGHKSTQMMKRYTHISGRALVDAIRGA